MKCRYTPDPNEVTLIPVIPVDGILHNEDGFCYDLTHECHENGESVELLNTAIQDGKITVGDADRIYRGQTV